jgi:ABC-type Fe3+/spermidine/putrescine transport system ATPase subunit
VLAVEPRVLLLDEPLNSLDRTLREEVREVIRRLQRTEGVTTLFVTHDQSEAVALADRIAVLFEGRLHQVDHPRAFYESPRDAQVARFFGGVNFLPGVKQGSVVQTALGPLAVADAARPDGEVVVTIRPEAIEIGPNGYNNITGFVRSYSYFGSAAHCCAEVHGVQFQVVAPPFTTFAADDPITLHLPPERICLLPGDMSGSPTQEDTNGRTQ